MRFIKGIIPLGSGKVTHGKAHSGGNVFLIAVEGAVFEKLLPTGKRSIQKGKIVSYADECYYCGDGLIERRGSGISYVSK